MKKGADSRSTIAAGWPGDGGEFVRTLAYVRFLDGEENGYRLHDWAEHNPYVADRPRRIEKARAAAAARWNPKKVDPQRMLAACSEHESAMPSSPLLHAPPDAARRTSPPFTETGFDLSLQKEKYSQSDFDERDLRKYTDERKKIDLKLGSGWGADLTDDQIFEHACFMAGFTAKHMREVFARLYPENSA